MRDSHAPVPLPEGLDISAADGQQTPLSVRRVVLALLKRLAALAARLHQHSSTSRRPPSTDAPEQKRQRRMQAGQRRKAGGNPGPPGPPQVLWEPPASVVRCPEACACGPQRCSERIRSPTPQVIALPILLPEVTPWLLHQGRCLACGTRCKASPPVAHASGYGPRLTGCIGAMAGMVGASRSAVQDVGASVWGISLRKGALQKRGDRVSAAILPHYTAIGQVARSTLGHSLDATSWRTSGDRHCLGVMANPQGAYFPIHPHCSKAAVAKRMADGQGRLVSDGYLVYQYWRGLRQRCFAPLICTARGLAERGEAGLARLGGRVYAALQRLWHMGTERPTGGQWRAWYARCRSFSNQHASREGKAGTGARRLQRAGEALGVFRDVPGVECTTNVAERAHRCGVLWRKRSQGTCSEQGNRGVARLLSLRHTCRIRGRPTFPILVEAVSCLFNGETSDLTWITHHASLPACSTR